MFRPLEIEIKIRALEMLGKWYNLIYPASALGFRVSNGLALKYKTLGLVYHDRMTKIAYEDVK